MRTTGCPSRSTRTPCAQNRVVGPGCRPYIPSIASNLPERTSLTNAS